MNDPKTDIFEQARPRLTGLAYRMLGSYSEAEDAVQETYLKWLSADIHDIQNPDGWMTTVCARLCLDHLKSAQRTRTDYVGTWLPEPVGAEHLKDGLYDLEISASLSTSFLLLLERLTPKERAAFLLKEIFDQPYSEVATNLEISVANCRKLVSRAKSVVGKPSARGTIAEDRKKQYVSAFAKAITDGDTVQLSALLSEDIHIHTDGGGKVPAASRTIIGKQEALLFSERILIRFWQEASLEVLDVNGSTGLLIRTEDGPHALATFEANTTGEFTTLYITRNPDKLKHF